MDTQRQSELLLKFGVEAGKHSMHGPVFPMFRELWKLVWRMRK